MDKNRKIPTEKEMIDLLQSGKVALPPLSLRVLMDRSCSRVQVIIISASLPQCSHVQTCLNFFSLIIRSHRIEKGGA